MQYILLLLIIMGDHTDIITGVPITATTDIMAPDTTALSMDIKGGNRF